VYLPRSRRGVKSQGWGASRQRQPVVVCDVRRRACALVSGGLGVCAFTDEVEHTSMDVGARRTHADMPEACTRVCTPTRPCVHACDKRAHAYDTRANAYDKRVQAYDKCVHAYDKRVQAYDKRVQAYDKRVQAYDKRVQAYDKRFHAYDEAAYRGGGRPLAEGRLLLCTRPVLACERRTDT
jgi:hypothetical protein